jgi:hypothetical protein
MGRDYVAMQLFHHIVVFSSSPISNITVSPREVFTVRLRSLDPKQVRDSSMTVPMLREWIAKMVADGRERLKQEAAVQSQWPRGERYCGESVELMKSGKKEQALNVLDPAIAEAIEGNHRRWVSVLSRHTAALSRSMGDRERQIHYEQQALPFAGDYRFAAYNFAQLLLSDGQLVRAERYAAEAYMQSIAQTSEADGDLRAAILKQWPNAAQSA